MSSYTLEMIHVICSLIICMASARAAVHTHSIVVWCICAGISLSALSIVFGPIYRHTSVPLQEYWLGVFLAIGAVWWWVGKRMTRFIRQMLSRRFPHLTHALWSKSSVLTPNRRSTDI